MSLASSMYSAVARARRRWYDRRPDARRRLGVPVISVGNLRVGGTGKTPMVAWVARALVAMGERPAILSRGYARRARPDGVVVASDGTRVLAPAALTGDEPQMLARSLAGVAVLVAPDRYVAGRLAETRFGCTVHVLDDGFQHLALARDVDVLMMTRGDLRDQVLPSGRLRESLDAARLADAVCLDEATADEARQVAAALGVTRGFGVARRLGAPRRVEPFGAPAPDLAGARVFAVAGIAGPQRFLDALRSSGMQVVGEQIYRDHHWFAPRDLARIAAAARAAGADAIVTTEKDAVRIVETPAGRGAAGRAGAGGARTGDEPPWVFVPLELDVDPAAETVDWLRARLDTARAERHDAPGTRHGARGTTHVAPGIAHPAPGTQHEALHEAPGSMHTAPPAAPGTKHPAP